jgi:hypothetical protein
MEGINGLRLRKTTNFCFSSLFFPNEQKTETTTTISLHELITDFYTELVV